MPIVQLPDGTHVEIPDTPAAPKSGVPEWMQDLVKYGPGFAKESGKALLRGFATMAANLGEGAGALAGEGMRSPNITSSPKPQVEITKALPDNLGESSSARVYRRGLEGTGAAFSLPLPGVGPVVLGTQGAAAGMAGEGARQVAESVAPDSPAAQNAADILGSLFGGALTGFTLGPKQSVGQADIRKALTGTTPQQFDQATANAAQAQSVGAKTATGAEAFSPNSGVMALAKNARASSADNALRVKTAERPEDLRQLGQEFQNRILPVPVDPNQVANSAAGSANAALAETKSLRSQAIGNRLAGQDVPFLGIEQLISDLRKIAGSQQRPGAGEAYRQVANAMLDQTQQPITNLQQLSLALKGLKSAAKNPNNPVFSGGTIDSVDLARALDAAETGLNQLNPTFGQAMGDFRAFSQGPMAAERVGPIGSLADRNPLLAGQTPVSRLEGMLSGNSPTTVEGTARTLGSNVMTGGNATSPLEIARALAQQKLRMGTTDPGNAVRGLPGSQAEEQFRALLKAGGTNADDVMAPLAVADRLQPFSQPANLNEGTRMQLRQLFIRPLRTIDMMTTQQSLNSVNHEVARLLADGSPAAIRKLQEIGMFDPNVRRMLTAKALLQTAGAEE